MTTVLCFFVYTGVRAHEHLHDHTWVCCRLPELKVGDTVDVTSLALKEGKTEPPDYLSEAELIGLMEKVGSQTDPQGMLGRSSVVKGKRRWRSLFT